MNRLIKPLCLLGAWVLAAAASAPAQAETYRVDLIVFLNPANSEGGQPLAPPDLTGAIDTDDASRLKAAGIEILPDAQFGLNDQWQHLRYSKQFKPLLRLAWTQKDPPTDRGPSLHVKLGATATTPPLVDGSVALLLNHYLHVDADLQYQAEDQRWRLDERRRMRRDEVHHLDSARLGILTKVTKAGDGPDNTP